MSEFTHFSEAIVVEPLHADALGRGGRALGILAVVFAVGFPVYLLTAHRTRIVQYVSDDAYYYFNVAAHLAAGDGPTADGVTVTTGFHPLYGFLLAGIHYLTHPSLDGFVREAVVVNALCFIAAGIFLGKSASALCNRRAGLAAALLWWTNPHGLLISSVGLEGALYSLTLAVLFWRISKLLAGDPATRRPMDVVVQSVWIGVCGGLTVLSRTDSLLFIPFVGLLLLLVPGRIPLSVRSLCAVAGIVIPLGFLSLWWWYTWEHTGIVVQGSAAVKTAWRDYFSDKRTEFMTFALACRDWLKYVVKCALKVPALKWCIPVIPAILSLRRRKLLETRTLFMHVLWIVPAGLGVAYVFLIDRPRTWYYVPAIAGLTIICAVGFHHLTAFRLTHPLQLRLKKALPLVVWLVVVESTAVFVRNTVSGRSKEQKVAVRAAQRIDRELDPSVVMGCWHSGIMQYYTPQHTVINLDGLANNEILRVLDGELSMNEYWDERGITVILGEPRVKMGRYKKRWDGKRLEPLAPGAQRVVSDDRH